jgi:hypothetical protein
MNLRSNGPSDYRSVTVWQLTQLKPKYWSSTRLASTYVINLSTKHVNLNVYLRSVSLVFRPKNRYRTVLNLFNIQSFIKLSKRSKISIYNKCISETTRFLFFFRLSTLGSIITKQGFGAIFGVFSFVWRSVSANFLRSVSLVFRPKDRYRTVLNLFNIHIPVNLWELLGGRSPPYQLF